MTHEQNEGRARQIAAVTKHGHAKGGKQTSEYGAWRDMKDRCLNSNAKDYQYYGGRGVKVCERWLDSFANFIADVGPKPSPDHTLDRKDNEGHYSPENCRWATREEQANNTRSNVFIEFGGERMTLMQWSKKLGVPANTLYSRRRYGWSDQEIIEGIPVHVFIVNGGERMTMMEWARKLGVSPQTLYSRRRLGWSDQEIIEGRKT